VKMKKGNLSKYCKLATVLLIDVIPVWIITTWATNDEDLNSDFLAFGLLIMFLLFFFWNIWAFIIYYLTKRIKKPWLCDILFYILLFLFLFFPLYFMYR
jgi:hypothetical protein